MQRESGETNSIGGEGADPITQTAIVGLDALNQRDRSIIAAVF
jgi:hypothetical protein